MKVDIKDLQALLPIDKDRLDEELAIQAEVQWRIAEHVVTQSNCVIDLKYKLDKLEAQIAIDLTDANPKLSIERTKNQVRVDRERDGMYWLYAKSRTELDQWSNLHDAWKARGYALKSLCDLAVSNYFTSDGYTKRVEIDRDHQKGREALAKAREESKRERIKNVEETTTRPRRTMVED